MALTFVTVADAIREVAKNMGLTNNADMTPYSNEAVAALLASAHELIRAEHEWGEMVRRFTRTPDGSTGKVTQLITGCSDWKLIRRIYQAGFRTPLPMLSSYVSPIESTSLMLGYRPLAPEDDAAGTAGRYLVQFYPLVTVSTVLFEIERTIDFAVTTTVVPIDFWLHVWYASWMWACDDGANPSQEMKFKALMTKRMQQVTARENSRPTFAQPNQLTPNDWWEADAPYA